MTKYSLLLLFAALAIEPAAHAQFGIVSNFGAATGRKISSQMDASLRNGTRGFGGGGSKSAKGGATASAAAAAKPAANVPPPPPPPPPAPQLQRRVSNVKKNTVPAWMLESAQPKTESADAPKEPVKEPVNVDLAQIERGMPRETLLALGSPSSKMTLFEEGHLVEVYHYRNQNVASGTVRLRDGAVVTIEARP
jgi:hypothetical protein